MTRPTFPAAELVADVLEHGRDAFFALDDTWRFTYLDTQAAHLLGAPASALRGESIWTVLPQIEETAIEEKFRYAMSNQKAASLNIYYDSLDTGVDVRIYPDDPGLSVYFSDTTERNERRRPQPSYEQLFDAIADAVWLVDPDGRILDVNRGLVDIFGVSREAILGERFGSRLAELASDPTQVETYRQLVADVLDGNCEQAGLEFQLSRHGQSVFFDIEITAVELDTGCGALIAARDATERVEREQRLSELNHFREAIIENANLWLNVLDSEANIVMWNRAAEEISGYDKEEVLGHADIWEWLYPDDAYRNEILDEVFDMLEQGRAVEEFETTIQTKSGEERIMSWNTRTFYDDGEMVGMVTLGRDVTEHRRRERELEQIRHEYETVFHNTQDALFLIDVDENGGVRLTRLNSVEEELAGLTTEEVKGKTPREVFGEETGSEIESNFRRCIRKRETITYDETLSLPGGTRCWQTKLTPVLVDGDVVKIVGAARDITALREYEQQLEWQRNQLELLNQIVRHDIRNDMSIIQGYGGLLRESIPESLEKDVDRILDASRHTTELTKTARDIVKVLSNEQESAVVAVELEPVLAEQVEDLRTRFADETVEIVGDVPDATVCANGLLGTVFQNLLHNAVQHNVKDEIHVSVTATEHDESVVVSVADNGPGIADEYKETIFGKGEKGLESPGTGMGLYLVSTLVDQYGGSVWVEDNDPEGAVFNVELEKVTATSDD
ncbi:PAS domain S-box protein [Haloferax sp. S1W]|uniref:PAS domain S-box protein n=1 Tax=Haloferax sp. S1W TaxID=3377110 RepID=UPI0037C5EE0E